MCAIKYYISYVLFYLVYNIFEKRQSYIFFFPLLCQQILNEENFLHIPLFLILFFFIFFSLSSATPSSCPTSVMLRAEVILSSTSIDPTSTAWINSFASQGWTSTQCWYWLKRRMPHCSLNGVLFTIQVRSQ